LQVTDLPVDLWFEGGSRVLVRWMSFGSRQITEPFFMQTTAELRKSSPLWKQCFLDLLLVPFFR
jgi:hypothetical protein